MAKILSGRIEKLDIKETLRYLGYAGVKSVEGIEQLLAECEGMLMPVLAPKAVYEIFRSRAAKATFSTSALQR